MTLSERLGRGEHIKGLFEAFPDTADAEITICSGYFGKKLGTWSLFDLTSRSNN